MKNKIHPFFIIVAFSTMLPIARATNIELAKIGDIHQLITWSIDKEKFEKVSLWTGDTEPPLSIEEALRIAKTSLSSKYKKNQNLHLIALQRPISTWGDAHYFFYFVEFDSGDCVVVLFNGSIVPPASKSYQSTEQGAAPNH